MESPSSDDISPTYVRFAQNLEAKVFFDVFKNAVCALRANGELKLSCVQA
jgi:hypothetical protein